MTQVVLDSLRKEVHIVKAEGNVTFQSTQKNNGVSIMLHVYMHVREHEPRDIL